MEIQFSSFSATVPFYQQSSNKNSGKQRSNNTNKKSCSKSFDRSGTKYKQYKCGKTCCNVGIQNGGKRISKPIFIGLGTALAFRKFLFDPLINKYVGIHCHTHGKHNTRNTGKGKYG